MRGVLATQATDGMTTVTDWLAQLALLHEVPFRFLIPDERMLSVESVRFFYVDGGWIGALLDGALSIGVEGSRDLELTEAWSAPLVQAVAAKVGGVRARRRGRPDLAVDTAPAATPPRFTAAALEGMSVTLRCGPVVADFQPVAGAGAPDVVLQRPTELTGTWSLGESTSSGTARYRITPADQRARFPETPAKIRTGWLQLTGALGTSRPHEAMPLPPEGAPDAR